MTTDVFYHSAELRWFLPDNGQIGALLHWLKLDNTLPVLVEGEYDPKAVAGPFVKQERLRTDEYLLLPAKDTVGVKQRQGRLEVKALMQPPQPFAHADIAGLCDAWVKWSFNPTKPTAQTLAGELDAAGPWAAVEKVRYLLKLSLDSGQPVLVTPDERPAVGCNVELTTLTLNFTTQPWLTFGFEAFGAPDQVMGYLQAAVQHFCGMARRSPLVLDATTSGSYPVWLAGLV
ncbi:MAG: hypothetical protein WAZ19_11100 [Anaerolineae bacterium]